MNCPQSKETYKSSHENLNDTTEILSPKDIESATRNSWRESPKVSTEVSVAVRLNTSATVEGCSTEVPHAIPQCILFSNPCGSSSREDEEPERNLLTYEKFQPVYEEDSKMPFENQYPLSDLCRNTVTLGKRKLINNYDSSLSSRDMKKVKMSTEETEQDNIIPLIGMDFGSVLINQELPLLTSCPKRTDQQKMLRDSSHLPLKSNISMVVGKETDYFSTADSPVDYIPRPLDLSKLDYSSELELNLSDTQLKTYPIKLKSKQVWEDFDARDRKVNSSLSDSNELYTFSLPKNSLIVQGDQVDEIGDYEESCTSDTEKSIGDLCSSPKVLTKAFLNSEDIFNVLSRSKSIYHVPKSNYNHMKRNFSTPELGNGPRPKKFTRTEMANLKNLLESDSTNKLRTEQGSRYNEDRSSFAGSDESMVEDNEESCNFSLTKTSIFLTQNNVSLDVHSVSSDHQSASDNQSSSDHQSYSDESMVSFEAGQESCSFPFTITSSLLLSNKPTLDVDFDLNNQECDIDLNQETCHLSLINDASCSSRNLPALGGHFDSSGSGSNHGSDSDETMVSFINDEEQFLKFPLANSASYSPSNLSILSGHSKSSDHQSHSDSSQESSSDKNISVKNNPQCFKLPSDYSDSFSSSNLSTLSGHFGGKSGGNFDSSDHQSDSGSNHGSDSDETMVSFINDEEQFLKFPLANSAPSSPSNLSILSGHSKSSDHQSRSDSSQESYSDKNMISVKNNPQCFKLPLANSAPSSPSNLSILSGHSKSNLSTLSGHATHHQSENDLSHESSKSEETVASLKGDQLCLKFPLANSASYLPSNLSTLSGHSNLNDHQSDSSSSLELLTCLPSPTKIIYHPERNSMFDFCDSCLKSECNCGLLKLSQETCNLNDEMSVDHVKQRHIRHLCSSPIKNPSLEKSSSSFRLVSDEIRSSQESCSSGDQLSSISPKSLPSDSILIYNPSPIRSNSASSGSADSSHVENTNDPCGIGFVVANDYESETSLRGVDILNEDISLDSGLAPVINSQDLDSLNDGDGDVELPKTFEEASLDEYEFTEANIEHLFDKLSRDEVKLLAEKLGEKLNTEIGMEASKIHQEDTATSSEFFNSNMRSSPLKSFLTSLVGKNPDNIIIPSTKSRLVGLLTKTYETLLVGTNMKAIPPRARRDQMERNAVLCSKAAYTEGGHIGGCYKTHLQDFVNEKIPDTIDPHGDVMDNAQRGNGKLGKKSEVKYNQKIEVNVSTNVIHVIPEKYKDSNILKKEENQPVMFREHPHFQPVSEDDLEDVKIRDKKKVLNAEKFKKVIMNKWMKEVQEDMDRGNGKYSAVEAYDLQTSKNTEGHFVCVICHSPYKYDVKSNNICHKCNHNPSFYENEEVGKIKKFGLMPQKENVEVKHAEPYPHNPSSYQALVQVYKELRNLKEARGDKLFVLVGDALIISRYLRLQRQIHCSSCDVFFYHSDEKVKEAHSHGSCHWVWPLDDVLLIDGESHEEMMMLINLNRALDSLGIRKHVQNLGFTSQVAQDVALRGKLLHQLQQICYPFVEGSMKALIWGCLKENPDADIDEVVRKLKTCKNLQTRALYSVLNNLGLPAYIKYLGLRLNRPDLTSAASSIYFPIACGFRNFMYRDIYIDKYLHESLRVKKVLSTQIDVIVDHPASSGTEYTPTKSAAIAPFSLSQSPNNNFAVTQQNVHPSMSVESSREGSGSGYGSPTLDRVMAAPSLRPTQSSDFAKLDSAQPSNTPESILTLESPVNSAEVMGHSPGLPAPGSYAHPTQPNNQDKLNSIVQRILEKVKLSRKPKSEDTYSGHFHCEPKEMSEFKMSVSIVDRSGKGEHGQGADMIQEEFLREALKQTRKGKILDFKQFLNGVRISEGNRRSRSQANKSTQSTVKRRKHETMIQAAAILQMKEGRIFNIEENVGLRGLDEDLLNINKKCQANLDEFVTNFITGAPSSSIHLEPVFITKEDRNKYHNIENKTKKEIWDQIKSMMENTECEEAEDLLSKGKNKCTNFRKEELLYIYTAVSKTVCDDAVMSELAERMQSEETVSE